MDEDNIKTLLEEEIAGEFGELSSLQVGSEEHTRAVDNLVKLYKLRIDEAKADMDYREKRDRREMEAEQFKSDLERREQEQQLKRDQLEEQIKERESDNQFREQEQQLKRDQLDEQIKEHEDETDFREREEQLKRDQMEDEALGRYIRLGAELASIVLPLMFYANWMTKGFKFEETGTFTSTTFKSLFNRFKPTGK